ncbi:MAG: hypothetical protein SGBAC_012349 [Bacillariaceae sp.]
MTRVESIPPRPIRNHVVGHNAHHGGCAGSEFPKDDATSTVSVAFVASVHEETSGSTSSGLLPAHCRKLSSLPSQSQPQSQQLRTQVSAPSASQHPKFASLFAKKKKNFRTTIPPTAQEEPEDTIMSIEKVLPDQQVVSAKKTHRKRTPQRKAGQTSGRWTNQEHQAFLDGLKEFGREWKKVATRIPTRTSAQIRSHAQKYFAKLQRDQETIMNLNSSAITENQNGMMEPPRHQQPLTPSVQQKMERLMADPQAVQREVEDTLQALREHYRRLQAQLERKQQQQQQGSIGGFPRKPMLLQPAAPIIAPEETEVEVSSVGSRKRTLQDMELESTTSSQQQVQQQVQQQQQDHDDHSSVTTNISASVASLDNEELIALHVLGGALPRNDSHSSMRDLTSAVASALYKQDSPASSKTTKTVQSPTKDNNNQE